RLGRASVWRDRICDKALRAIERLPTTRECPLALVQPLVLRQVSRRQRAIRFQADFYLTAPATARPLLPERPLLAARSLQQSLRKCPHGRIARVCRADS